tara:strand:- start:200 stop:505 length:306 start_codon:yes stop_codon:yes gene_type:complete
MTSKYKAFCKKSIELLKTLNKDQEPQWDSLTPQHMVKHLVGPWRISNGRARVPQMLFDGDVQIRRESIFSDKPYARNISNPTAKTRGNAPLREESLSAVID